MHNTHAAPSLQYNQSYSCRARCPRQTIHGSVHFSYNETPKCGTDVYFTKSLKNWPRRDCDKKAPKETTPEQSVIMTSQLLATGSYTDDVTINKPMFFKSPGGVTVYNVEITSVRLKELYLWSVHRIHGVRNKWEVFFKERQAPRFRRI